MCTCRSTWVSLLSKSYCHIYSYCLIPDKVTLCNIDTNVCTYCLYHLTHKFPEQTVIMTLNPRLTNLYRTLQHRASLASTTARDGFIPPQGRPGCCISHVPQPILRQQWSWFCSQAVEIITSGLDQRAGLQQIYSVQYIPSINKDDFVNFQELRNW